MLHSEFIDALQDFRGRPQIFLVGEKVTYYADISSDAPNTAGPYEYVWTFDDGEVRHGIRTDKVWMRAGRMKATVRSIDMTSGLWNESDVYVTIRRSDEEIYFAPPPIIEPAEDCWVGPVFTYLGQEYVPTKDGYSTYAIHPSCDNDIPFAVPGVKGLGTEQFVPHASGVVRMI